MLNSWTPTQARNRPQVLLRAARAGIVDYDRKRSLRRLIRAEAMPSPAEAVSRLSKLEAETDERRRTGARTYSILRHVELLIALMGEARLARH